MKKILSVWISLFFIFPFLLSGCEIKYKPTKFAGLVYNTQTGTLQAEGSIVIPTLIGEFEISTTYPEDFSGMGDFILIIRDRSFMTDKVYSISNANKNEKIDIFISGKARVIFENHGAIVEIIEGEAIVIDLRSVSQKDISWLNSPFPYRPFKTTQQSLSLADKYMRHPGFILFCPSFIIGVVLYALVVPAFILDLLLFGIIGLGLLLNPLGLTNIYYASLILGVSAYIIKKSFVG